MRLVPALILLAGAGFLRAQTADDPEISAARAEIAKVRALVEAGAAPRAQLAKAEESLADAADAALLRKTAYGQDLNVEQAGRSEEHTSELQSLTNLVCRLLLEK